MSAPDPVEAPTGQTAQNGETALPILNTTPARRARVAVLGEFSAGKSTFINLVTGGKTLRTQVTATQMPAVWMSYGNDAPYSVDLDGTERPVDLKDLSGVTVADTAYIRIFLKTPVLELCDLIDTPGNSDPNIAPIAWERIAAIADVAVWCSPATQAWRQSEAAAWSEMPERLRANSVLVLTRADKLTTDEDRAKVLRRVKAEAGDLFKAVHMASLLNLTTVQPAFREVIRMCRALNETATPGPVDTAHILREMGAASANAPASGSAEISPATRELQADAGFARAERMAGSAGSVSADEPEAGYATQLWHQLTETLPPDDDEALDHAFTTFLVTMDREIAMLRDIANIGKKD